MIVFPNCKINLGLQVRRKRADGFHDLETVFYPLPLHDSLEVVQAEGRGTATLAMSGIPVTASPAQNLCFKAYELLKKRFPDLPSVHMHLHKVLPSGAGMGGGSADAAFTLLLLNDKLGLHLERETLAALALELGSDCPFFIYNRPCFASGRGEELEPVDIDLSGHQLVIIHRGLHIPTADAFRKIIPNDDRPSLRHILQLPVSEWREALHNDFEDSVFPQHPVLAETKQALYSEGALYASMTGSGSAVYGIFPKGERARLPAHLPSDFVRAVQL